MPWPNVANDGPFYLPLTNNDRHSRKPSTTTGMMSSIIWSPTRRPLLVVFSVAMSCVLLISVVYPPKLWLKPPHPSGRGPPGHPGPPPFFGDEDWDTFEDVMNHKPEHSTSQESPFEGDPEETLWTTRAETVKAEFLYAYHAYENHAMPSDELQPLTSTSINNYNGWGVSVIDSIDTMILMGAKEEYDRALQHVINLDMRKATTTLPFFETTIRYLGGFLSAYALTNETIFLSKADQLGQELLPVFDTPLGVPIFSVHPSTGKTENRWGKDTLLAEIGTCQLEFQQLAHYTGRPEYFEKVDRMTRLLRDTQSEDTGMWGTVWDTVTAKQKNDKLAVGGEADSAYEYLIKSYLQSSRHDHRTQAMFVKAINGIINNLLYISPTRNLLYVTDSSATGTRQPSNKLEHLSCFLPGVIALGVRYLPINPNLGYDAESKKLWGWAAEGLGRTCWITYADQVSGLGPDEVMFNAWPGDTSRRRGLWISHVHKWQKTAHSADAVPPGVRDGTPLHGMAGAVMDYHPRNNNYQLRPETIESLYVLFKTTGDPIWRDRAWEIFEAIRKHSKVERNSAGTGGGYANVMLVNTAKPAQTNSMPSWYLAETLKYMYLIASPKDLVPLDRWVFNTEAHPLPIPQWRAWEKEKYWPRTNRTKKPNKEN
ncbi:hypothetical protein FRB95_012176 [Tulasnella sp. JGI-2019a]|nr:hypothetical protein FRB93_013481 [Tulasnella sp. JGI-2019a]KAG9035028.1 hypothetical protein FRB95_012176 [Tulasnella sp. JGI-2019a]